MGAVAEPVIELLMITLLAVYPLFWYVLTIPPMGVVVVVKVAANVAFLIIQNCIWFLTVPAIPPTEPVAGDNPFEYSIGTPKDGPCPVTIQFVILEPTPAIPPIENPVVTVPENRH